MRETLPRLCEEASGAVDAEELEAFIVGQLNSSALDAAVKVRGRYVAAAVVLA